jgi:uncharacterized protein (DUF885 family)
MLTVTCSSPNKEEAAEASSGTYEELVSLFQEFREFQEPAVINGVPDYSPVAMEKQKMDLKEFQARLAAIDPNSWPIPEKVDYVLVWTEMNGMEFYQHVLKPWSRDPVFYLPSQGGAGPVIDINLRIRSLPIPDDRMEEFKTRLKAIPEIYKQAEQNLTEAAGDLALLALYYIEREAGRYQRLANRLAEHHPDLVPDAERARDAVKNYGKWLEENKSSMTAPAGIGVENYNWWLKNVHLFPYSHAECQAIVEHEYNRIITFLKLEENRNRHLPPLEVADTAEEWYRRLDIALNYVLEWLRKEEILTVPDWIHAEDYSDPSEPRRDLPSEPTIDSRAREREVLPGETHEFIGHLFDEFRPIRGVRRLYNMDWIRSEGWAAGTEELFMVAGVLDKRPQRGREIEYLMNASHMSLSLPDLKMHSNEINFTEARKLCAEIMPYNWSHEDDRMVWYEQQSNLRFPAFHTGVVMGKAQLTKLFRERAMQLGDEFVLRDFFDEFLAAGMIPMSLTRWEMTGFDDEIKEICPLIK